MGSGVHEPSASDVLTPLHRGIAEDASKQGGRRRRVLAVSSGGGHWVQMMRLAPVLEAHDVAYVTVGASYRCDVNGAKFYTVTDATAWNKVKMLWQAFQILMIVLRQHPDVVISTGAAPGYFAIRFAKWLGARTVWIDSIANVERLSRAGACVEPYADLWLTQWQHLAIDPGPSFRGTVL